MAADGSTDTANVDLLEILHWDDHMRNSTIHKMPANGLIAERNLNPESQVLRFAHFQERSMPSSGILKRMMESLFVYGTLRRGCPRAMSLRFPTTKFIAEAEVSGSLYDLGAYPGLLHDESSSLVIGEVYEVADDTLTKLDDFEASSNYRRKQVEISLGTDKRIGWIYEPNPELYSLRTLITSGDWVEYAKTKTDWPGDEPTNETQN